MLNLTGVVLPFLGVLLAIVLLWDEWVDWTSLAIMAGMYVAVILGVTLGFHRLFTHRSFATYKPVEYFLAILGSMAVEGPVMNWVADHRKHHAHTDQDGDPHSPHGHGEGFKGAISGLYYAHIGWLFDHSGTSDHKKYARDLYEDPGMQRINRLFQLWALIGFLIPAALGLAITGTWRGAFEAALWGGLVRTFLVHHVTWSINSICHFFGRRRFEVDDHSTNVAWLSLLSMGESWHHNHHTFPRSAFHGLRGWERRLDPTAWVIRLMRRTKLAWNVVEITPERQQQKLVA